MTDRRLKVVSSQRTTRRDRQEAFLEALAAGATPKEAREQIGAHRSTIRDWLREDQWFRERIAEESDHAWMVLGAAASRAAATLAKSAGGADVSPVSVAAARTLLDLLGAARGLQPATSSGSLVSRVAEIYGLPSAPQADVPRADLSVISEENTGDPDVIDADGETASPNGPPTEGENE